MYQQFKDSVNIDESDVAPETSSGSQDTQEPEEITEVPKPRVELEIQEKWEREQQEMKEALIVDDVDDWSKHHILPEEETSDEEEQAPKTQDKSNNSRPLEYIGGVDISFVKGDDVNACAAFVVLNYPQLEVVHEDLSMIELTAPYISGFLGFREAEFLVEKVDKLRKEKPDILPQVIMVDGNGILHPRGCGLACHIGIKLDIPTIGVAKKLLHVDGISKSPEHQANIKDTLLKGGDTFPLIGEIGTELGEVLRSSDSAPNPIYVSPGHKISVRTATWAVKLCCKHRIPEPTRQADIRSREYLRVNFPPQTEPNSQT